MRTQDIIKISRGCSVKAQTLYRIEPGDLMDLQENLKVGNSLRTLKHIQMENQASKQGEAGVFCELLI